MPEITLTGSAGRLEGRYQPGKSSTSPVAVILHPHPQFGGTMNNQIVYKLYYLCVEHGMATIRFNFRGVERSQGYFDYGPGELADAASALDWLQANNPESRGAWIAGFSFGAWIGMQLLMRRPEVEGFISIAPPTNIHDFSFLAPCPSSGLIIHGTEDKLAPPDDVQMLVDKLQSQKGIKVEQQMIEHANHFFENRMDTLIEGCDDYLTRRLQELA